MAKNKEQCPYCGNYYVYLNRHKCPKDPNGNQQVVEIEEIKLENENEEAGAQGVEEEVIVHKTIPATEDLIIESHNSTIQFISKFFKQESFNIGKEKDKNIIKGVFNNSIDSFKFLNNLEVNFIKAILMANTVGDLLTYREKNIFNFISSEHLKTLEKKGIQANELIEKIQKAIVIASILNQLREKSLKINKPKDQQKIIVAGLDQAGKTAILSTFGGKFGLDELATLRPTKKIERRNIETDKLSLFIWDFGGQSKYRLEYLKNPGAFFIGVDLLIYVIDIQDYERFDESFKYLKGIIDALKLLEEKPHILVFVHKYDPDLREDPDIQLNVEFVKENLREILLNINFSYEIYLTSIYSVISKEPQFSKYIKEMITQQKDLVSDPTHDKIEALGDIIKNVLNAIMRLSESSSRQYYDLEQKFLLLEARINSLNITSRKGDSAGKKAPASISVIDLIKPIQEGPPAHLNPPKPIGALQPIQQSATPIQTSQQTIRSSVISELRDLFTKAKDLKG